ncbi:MAG: LytTR family DNA-binding domain-containing protein [Bacteroidia bacterium]
MKRVLPVSFVVLFTAGTIFLDWFDSMRRNSSFYFSESFMFTAVWWLFLPMLYLQLRLTRRAGQWYHFMALIIFPVILHLCLYPLLVKIISAVFYYHTFEYRQTLLFGISSYTLQLLLIYALLPIYFLFRQRKLKVIQNEAEFQTQEVSAELPVFYSHITVTDKYRKVTVPVSDILFITADTPYINLHLSSRNYLHNETLKSITAKLDPRFFVRIHKSTIINLAYVETYISRHNGDYDLTLAGGSTHRVSRNYAAAFREQLLAFHQLTTN